VSAPERPELDVCSRCKEHAEFYLTSDNDDLLVGEQAEWLSDCCSAPAVKVDVEASDL